MPRPTRLAEKNKNMIGKMLRSADWKTSMTAAAANMRVPTRKLNARVSAGESMEATRPAAPPEQGSQDPASQSPQRRPLYRRDAGGPAEVQELAGRRHLGPEGQEDDDSAGEHLEDVGRYCRHEDELEQPCR